MKKRILVVLLSLLTFITVSSALTMDDLDIPDKMTVEEYLIEHFDEITSINVEEFEGEKYEIILENDEYIIIVVDGTIYIILK
ncbi:MAG: hypothetical protein KAU01_10080 [Candidatus Cloacimonetes bacterium]|nr:hypothetical protein [Candidatus Cloacimonadota bacterium]